MVIQEFCVVFSKTPFFKFVSVNPYRHSNITLEVNFNLSYDVAFVPLSFHAAAIVSLSTFSKSLHGKIWEICPHVPLDNWNYRYPSFLLLFSYQHLLRHGISV